MAEESKFMLMIHKNFPDRNPAKVLRSQFEKRWKEKGWVEFTPKEKEASTTATTPTSPTTPTGGNKDK